MNLNRLTILSLFKSKVKEDYAWLYLVYKNVRFLYRTWYLLPTLQKMRPNYYVPIIKLGSDHGWAIGDREYLGGSIAISAGLGQDASFDIEFLNRFGASIVLIDPTPTSIDYFNDMAKSFGKSKGKDYVKGGAQPINSYDLRLVNERNIRLIPNALYNRNDIVNFFEPKVKGHNSYSISNIFKTDEFISIEAITFKTLLDKLGIEPTEIILVKLDIEGAASEVLFDFLGDVCLPSQILVEFEEVFTFSFSNAKKLYRTFQLLNSHHYKLIHTDKLANFTFERHFK